MQLAIDFDYSNFKLTSTLEFPLFDGNSEIGLCRLIKTADLKTVVFEFSKIIENVNQKFYFVDGAGWVYEELLTNYNRNLTFSNGVIFVDVPDTLAERLGLA
jgi:hypothetical protein